MQAGQLVVNALGQTGAVLGVKYEKGGQPELWARWDGSGLEAPVDTANRFTEAATTAEQQPGFQLCSAAQQIQRDAAALAAEQRALAARWAAYEAERLRAEAAAAKAAAKKKKPPPPPPPQEEEGA